MWQRDREYFVIAYTDGSTHIHNPGPISWAVVYVDQSVIVHEDSGALWEGTNNRAELMGVIWAMERCPFHTDLLIRSDSTYVVNIAKGLWNARSNLYLWQRFHEAKALRKKKGLKTAFSYVRGHFDDEYNKRADCLAKLAAKRAAECLVEMSV